MALPSLPRISPALLMSALPRGRSVGRVATVLALASCGLAACGNARAPGAAPTTTVTARATPAATTQPAGATSGGTASGGTASGGTASAGAPPGGPAGCLSSALQAALGQSQGTAGTFYQDIVLTNVSAAPCSLYGYPGVSFVTGVGGSQVGAAAIRNPAVPVAFVSLQPGGAASMVIALHDAGAYPPAQCQLSSVDWLRIYPPGDYGSVYVQYRAQTCAKQAKTILSVTAVRPGAGTASY